MELTVSYLGDLKLQAEVRGHQVLCDQPRDAGGTDQGMTPAELFLVSIAACAGHYAAYYLKTRNLPAAGLKVHLSCEKQAQPARLDQFVIRIVNPAPLSEKDTEGVKRAAEKCLVKNTIMGSPSMNVVVEAGAAGAGQAALP